MPGAPETIQSLLDNGKRVFFVTNNAASSRMELKEKLENVLRFPGGTLTEEMMIGSAFVAAQYLYSRLLHGSDEKHNRVHVIGSAGLCKELQSAGFNVSGGPDPIDTPSGMSRDELAAYSFSEGDIDALVIGLDNDFNYRKLCIATVLLQRNPQALLVATNRDAFDLVGHDARHLP
jgi:ribonucleotide monophosphatase NagD (HAD superfamily)